MHTRDSLSQLIENYINDLQLPAHPAELYHPIVYSLSCGGKRLRPLVALMACDVLGGEVSDALPIAGAVEVFHNFTLLHDDIMDNAPMRRGKPAVHAHWSSNTAILSGDVMMIYSYKLLAMSPEPHIAALLDEFNLMGTEVCEGQQFDMDFEARDSVSEKQYMEMIGLKTASLIARSAKMGAMAAGASPSDCMNMYRFGYELGLAFQLQDDLLDSYSDSLAFGKKIGGDIIEGKKSFLTVQAILRENERQQTELLSLLADRTMDENLKVERVRAIYNALDIPAITERRIKLHIGMAIDALRKLSVDSARLEPLRELAEGMVDRKK